MTTNALGLRIAEWRMDILRAHGADPDGKYLGTTLGAYRRGKHMPWVTGATIDVWMPCARAEGATGVPWPHAYYITTIGGTLDEGAGSMYCPGCRAELAAARTTGVVAAAATPSPPQSALPF